MQQLINKAGQSRKDKKDETYVLGKISISIASNMMPL